MDERALRILFDTYWSPEGWKSAPTTAPEDFEYAVNAGYMFEPRHVSHDEAVACITAMVPTIDPAEVVGCFLASLSTRRLELRSALGSYAVARHLPAHTLEPMPSSFDICRVCGANEQEDDYNVLNFERYKWGGVRHLDPFYIEFDLSQFSKMPKLTPTSEDEAIFSKIIEIAANMDTKAKPRDLERAISRVLKSNQSEREVLIQILGYCSILEPADHPGFLSRFVPETERTIPPVGKIDWDYPVAWWRGKDGVNKDALEILFPAQAAVQQ